MSKSEALRFVDDLQSGKITISSEDILAKGSRKEMHEYAKSFGYDFTPSEILEIVNEKNIISETELTEEQMAALVGGGKSVVIPVDINVVGSPVTVSSAAAAQASCL